MDETVKQPAYQQVNKQPDFLFFPTHLSLNIIIDGNRQDHAK